VVVLFIYADDINCSAKFCFCSSDTDVTQSVLASNDVTNTTESMNAGN